jgi:hypothetical protein
MEVEPPQWSSSSPRNFPFVCSSASCSGIVGRGRKLTPLRGPSGLLAPGVSRGGLRGACLGFLQTQTTLGTSGNADPIFIVAPRALPFLIRMHHLRRPIDVLTLALLQPRVVKGHAVGECSGIALFHHARDRVRAVIQGERCRGAMVSRQPKAAKGQLA